MASPASATLLKMAGCYQQETILINCHTVYCFKRLIVCDSVSPVKTLSIWVLLHLQPIHKYLNEVKNFRRKSTFFFNGNGL